MRAAALLLVVGMSTLAPDVCAYLFGGSIKAWDYVCVGTELSALWLLLAGGITPTNGERWVCLYGMFEALQRPVGRALFDMSAPPDLKPGDNLMDAATGWPVSDLSPLLLVWVCSRVLREIWEPTKVCSSNTRNDGA